MKKSDVEKIVGAILSHARLKDAAKSLGVDYSTLWRMMQTPALRESLAEAQRNLLREVIDSLRAGMAEAAEVLRKILADSKVKPGLKISAARVILEAGIKIITLAEIESRLSELEKKFEMKGKTR